MRSGKCKGDELILLIVGDRVANKLSREGRAKAIEHICHCRECYESAPVYLKRELGIEAKFPVAVLAAVSEVA